MPEDIKKLTKNLSITLVDAITVLMGAIIIAISSQISIPLPNGVPITLQTFTVALVGYCLPTKKSIKIILTYLLLGIIGIPVFAQGKAGIQVLFGLTGGFLFGFIFFILLCSKAKNAKHIVTQIALSVAGLLLCHLFGSIQYSILTPNNLIQSILLVSLPFLVKDGISVLLAYMVSKKANFNIGKQEK